VPWSYETLEKTVGNRRAVIENRAPGYNVYLTEIHETCVNLDNHYGTIHVFILEDALDIAIGFLEKTNDREQQAIEMKNASGWWEYKQAEGV
jgi:hypothetical protein